MRLDRLANPAIGVPYQAVGNPHLDDSETGQDISELPDQQNVPMTIWDCSSSCTGSS